MMLRQRILIVEPDVLLRHPLAEFLRANGYKVLEGRNAGEARELIANGTIAPDIVVCDVDAAPHDGFFLAAWSQHAHQRIGFLMAHSKDVEPEMEDACGHVLSVRKPYEHAAVLETIGELIAARIR